MRGVRRALYVNLMPEAWPRPGLSPLNRILVALILFSIVTAVLETEDALYIEHATTFFWLNLMFAIAFTAEYLGRVWAVGEDPARRSVMGRLRYVASWPALIDLLAVVPFYLGLGGDSYVLRTARLLRILTLIRIGRTSRALKELRRAIVRRRYELAISNSFALFALLISASVMYVVEGPHQPEAFGSIPRALWWSVATLTTVGYGDVYPATALGRVVAGISALAGILLIAMPAGILAAAFSDAFQKSDAASSRATPSP